MKAPKQYPPIKDLHATAKQQQSQLLEQIEISLGVEYKNLLSAGHHSPDAAKKALVGLRRSVIDWVTLLTHKDWDGNWRTVPRLRENIDTRFVHYMVYNVTWQICGAALTQMDADSMLRELRSETNVIQFPGTFRERDPT